MNEGNNRMILLLCRGKDFIGQVLIRKTKGTTQSVSDQVLGKSSGKIIFALSNQITHFKVVGKRRALVKFTGRINVISFLAAFVFGPPLTGGGKVFQTETYRINLTVTACALRFFLVSENPFSGGKGLVGQTGKLWNVWRSRGGWIIQKVT